jgi:hypothetical protein
MGMRRAQGSRSKQRAVISGNFIQFEVSIVDLASGEAVTGGEPLWIAPKRSRAILSWRMDGHKSL